MPDWEAVDHDPFEGNGPVLVPVDHDPFEAAAARVRGAVVPIGGRREGVLTRFSEQYVPHVASHVATLPQRAFEASETRRHGGDYDPAPIVESALMTVGVPGRPVGSLGSGIGKGPGSALPMNQSSRMARAAELGYSEEPFYRGGKLQDEYPGGAHFSRDEEYARGFALKARQPEPQEFRLKLDKTFRDYGDLTADQYGKLIAAARDIEPKLAARLASDVAPETVAPEKHIDWVLQFAKDYPDKVVATKGAPAAIRQAIERGSRAPDEIFDRAGFDAIDSGRDVRKLGGYGIRDERAAFDPARGDEMNIFASIAGLLGLGGAAANPNTDQR